MLVQELNKCDPERKIESSETMLDKLENNRTISVKYFLLMRTLHIMYYIVHYVTSSSTLYDEEHIATEGTINIKIVIQPHSFDKTSTGEFYWPF